MEQLALFPCFRAAAAKGRERVVSLLMKIKFASKILKLDSKKNLEGCQAAAPSGSFPGAVQGAGFDFENHLPMFIES